MKAYHLLAAGLVLGLSGAAADAASCRDAHGKFITCPKPAAAAKQSCHDARGKFVKCPASAAHGAAGSATKGR
ncbi:hypothetical protein [Sphingomonas fennica]|uniref:Uncharacterized protein n=1 Tax=Edaphosphingomonas fennica TaxID=114404 RepID=A0A2T4HJ58_9SPHN|nr:hypothetical protein [Sphingomonas fennica]PTD15840.1 hypothetical protein CV103_21765 [Sphingomonas fennica]